MVPKAFTDPNTIALPQSDAQWDGNLLPTPSAPGPRDVSGDHAVTRVIFLPFLLSQVSFPSNSVAAVPASHATLAWPFELSHFAHLTNPYADGSGGMFGSYLNFPST